MLHIFLTKQIKTYLSVIERNKPGGRDGLKLLGLRVMLGPIRVSISLKNCSSILMKLKQSFCSSEASSFSSVSYQPSCEHRFNQALVHLLLGRFADLSTFCLDPSDLSASVVYQLHFEEQVQLYVMPSLKQPLFPFDLST